MEYEVLKQHYGDKQYYEGDIRQLDDDFTAKRLIEFGLIGKAAEANKKVQSKAKKVPNNKAEPVLENKGDDSDDTEDNT